MAVVQRIAPCLWFDKEGEEAAKFYCSIFPNSKITLTSFYTEVGKEQHGKQSGDVMWVEFELDGQKFSALNGGPIFKFNEAISLMINCDTQEEIDHYWDKLTEGGDENAQQCGWLKDKFGVSWQVYPVAMEKMLQDTSTDASKRAFAAMMEMKKLDIATLEKAYAG